MSRIEWTDETWNPVRGCKKISAGCKNCYAATFAERWRGIKGHPYEQGFDIRVVPEMLSKPLHWMRPRQIFVNSMSDLFHEDVPDEFILQVFDVMTRADWHVFQLLTKRPGRMAVFLATHQIQVPDHVWLGVSVENRKSGIPRIETLRHIPCPNRFLSVEPLLEDLGTLNLNRIDWVIVGGESGHGARPMQPDWARSIRDQCNAAHIPFFFKQWGGVNKKKAGRLLDSHECNGVPVWSVATRNRTEKVTARKLWQENQAPVGAQ